MKPILVSEGIYKLSVTVEDILFEGLWEIPNGVSVNSYIIKGEKTAIVDGVCGWDGVPETLLEMLDSIDIDPKDINYVIINHMEPDHSGWIESFKEITSDFEVICTSKAEALLNSFFGHSERIRCIKDGDQLDLGNNRILTFYEVPNVHWPETMMTFDTLSKTLFSCDMFGTFGKFNNDGFDKNLSDTLYNYIEEEGLRYYSNVMSTFSLQVKKAIAKCDELPIKTIAPGHGLVWQSEPKHIIDTYKRYVEYSRGKAKHQITILWGSMYGMTELAVDAMVKFLQDSDIEVRSHRLPETSWGQVLTSALASSAIVVAAPTYEYKMFPPVATAIEELGRKKMTNRIGFLFGSHGWASGAAREFNEILERYRMKWDVVEAVEFKGRPDENDFEMIKTNLRKVIEKI